MAVHAVGHQRVHDVGDVVHDAAMARAESAPGRTAVAQRHEAREVLVQVAVRGSDDDGRAVHHVIPGQQHLVLLDRPAEVVRGMPWGVHRTQGETAGTELEARSGALVGLEALSGTEADHRGSGDRGERGRARGVVHMRVGHHDGSHRTERSGRGHDRLGVLGQPGRAGVDHDGIGVTDQVGVGARTGHQTRVRCGEPPDAGRHVVHPPGLRDRSEAEVGDRGDHRAPDPATTQPPGLGPGALSGPSRLASMDTAMTAALNSSPATSLDGSGTGASS